MMNREFKSVWIRLAGHAQMIKNDGEYHWRCFINRDGDEINLINWVQKGASSAKNVVPGTNPHKDHLGLVAWIDMYGDLRIDQNNVAYIDLLDPPTD